MTSPRMKTTDVRKALYVSVEFFSLFTMKPMESFKLGSDIILHFKKIILAYLWRELNEEKKWRQVLVA